MTPSPGLKAAAVALVWAGIVGANIAVLPQRHKIEARVEALSVAPLKLMVRAPGVLLPEKRATLKAGFQGPVIRKAFRDGQAVTKGDFLIEIGRDNIQAEYTAKANEVKNAEAELEKASNELRLQTKLYRKEAVARAAVDAAQTALDFALQKLEVSTTSFRVYEDRWNKNILTSPISGTVIKDSVADADEVASDKEIVSIADLSRYVLEAKVDEIDIGNIREGQEALVRLQAAADSEFIASVIKISAQGENRGLVQYPVTLRIASAARSALRPNFSGEGRILVGETEPVLSVPLGAIASKDGDRVVWLVSASGRLQSKKVAVGRSNPDRVEVTDGLAAGDRICVAAQPSFRNGMRVISLE